MILHSFGFLFSPIIPSRTTTLCRSTNPLFSISFAALYVTNPAWESTLNGICWMYIWEKRYKCDGNIKCARLPKEQANMRCARLPKEQAKIDSWPFGEMVSSHIQFHATPRAKSKFFFAISSTIHAYPKALAILHALCKLPPFLTLVYGRAFRLKK